MGESHWYKKQKRHHEALWLVYRKEELLWHLDVFLSVNHPQRVVDKFLADFEGNRKTMRDLFVMMVVRIGNLTPKAIQYQDDLDRVIGFMKYRQYIEVKENMLFRDIMRLPRVFDLSKEDRMKLRNELLNIEV